MITARHSKSDIMKALFDHGQATNNPISPGRAGKLADRIRSGRISPEELRAITWADPTGETACRRVMAAQHRKRNP